LFHRANLPIIQILKGFLNEKQLGCSVFMVICGQDTVMNITEPSFEKWLQTSIMHNDSKMWL